MITDQVIALITKEALALLPDDKRKEVLTVIKSSEKSRSFISFANFIQAKRF